MHRLPSPSARSDDAAASGALSGVGEVAASTSALKSSRENSGGWIAASAPGVAGGGGPPSGRAGGRRSSINSCRLVRVSLPGLRKAMALQSSSSTCFSFQEGSQPTSPLAQADWAAKPVTRRIARGRSFFSMADCLIYAADLLSDHIGDSDRQPRKPVRALSTIFAAVKDSRHEYRIRLDPILDDMGGSAKTNHQFAPHLSLALAAPFRKLTQRKHSLSDGLAGAVSDPRICRR